MLRDHHIWMCPVCQGGLVANGRQFICDKGHNFDVAREGYVNLILAHQRSSAEPGDPPDSVRHRRLFLEAGHYDPLAQQVVAMASTHLATASGSCGVPNSKATAKGHVLDAGCGEGWLLRKLQEARSGPQIGGQQIGGPGPGEPGQPEQDVVRSGEDLLPQGTRFHGVDLSRVGISLGARANREIAFAVGNSFRLPVLPHVVDLLIVMMAPSDEAEAVRVLKRTGVFLRIVPGADHLATFRSLVYNEAQPHADKQIPDGFCLIEQETVRFDLSLTTPESVAQLVEMTPYKWHMNPETYERVRGLSSLEDTADFVLQLMTPV